jgi:hypothetical protein
MVSLFLACPAWGSAALSAQEEAGYSRPILTYTKGNGDWIGVYHGEFRVDVFDDRSAVYEGFRKVRLVGKHRYQLTEEEYRSLLRVVDVARSRLQHNRLHRRLLIASVVVHSYEALYFNIISGSSDILLMREVERHLKARPLRCPYMLTGDRPGDVCKIEEEIEDRPG